MTVALSISIVNFNTVDFLEPLLQSIRDQEFTVDGRPGDVEVIIVDNASRGEDTHALRELEDSDDSVRLIQNTCNAGYAQANNQAFHVADSLYHMILNPDALLLPGCIKAMVGHLEANPESSMVGPLSFMDSECTVHMPPNEVPTPELFDMQTRAQGDADVAIENLQRRTNLTYNYWMASEPMEMEMLSGSCVLFRRDLFEGSHPFDPGYPLYYEDTDMFLRLRKAGKKLTHVPEARMIHYFSRSALTHSKGAEYRSRIAEERYYEKHFGAEGLETYRRNFELLKQMRDAGPPVNPFDFEQVSAAAQPPEFYVDSRHDNYYMEIAGNPIFTLAAATFPGEEGHFTISGSMWSELGPNVYWVRIVSRDSLETLQAWEVTKTVA